MPTRQDLIQRTLERMGEIRPGAAIDGDVFVSCDSALQDLLYELEQDPNGVGLDFDPTKDSIPAERMSTLVRLYRERIKSMFTDEPENEALFRHYKGQFFAGIIGPSNHVASRVEDY